MAGFEVSTEVFIDRACKGPNANAPIRGPKTEDAGVGWIPIDQDLRAWIAWRKTQTEGPWALPTLFLNPGSMRFKNPQRRWTANKLREVWNTAAESVGVEVGMYEGTKHSTGTNLYSSGMPLSRVQELFRHTDVRSTRLYTKSQADPLADAFDAARSRMGR